MSGNLTVVQNGGTWPWGGSPPVQSVEYRPIGSGSWQHYQLYDVSNNQPMWQTQGYGSSGTYYDIEREVATDQWADKGTDHPHKFAVSSSTTSPGIGNAVTGSVTATSTNKYLHMFTTPGTYIGYMDVWTPFHTSSTPTAFDNTNGQPNIGPITGGNYPSQFTGQTFVFVSSASSTTKLVYNAVSATDGSDGMEFTFNTGSGGTYICHVNAGNDTGNPNSIASPSQTNTGATAPCNAADTCTIYDSNGYYGTFSVPTFNTGSGSGSGSGGGIQTLSGGSTSEIINVSFSKLSDSSIEIGFDWQNISQFQVFTDRGGTVTMGLGNVTGNSGTITGYTGAGVHALTGLNEGDKVWVNNATDSNGDLPVFTNKFIEWSFDSSTTPPSVKAEAFFTSNGGNGFGFNADVGLFESGAVKDTQIYSGNLENMYTEAIKGNYYTVRKPDQSQYGQGYWYFKPSKSGGSHNFW